MLTKTHLMTGEDLLELPMGEGKRYELVEGELRIRSPAGNLHGAVAYIISVRVGSYILNNKLGMGFTAETGFYLRRNPDTVKAPDFAFISKERIPAEGLPQGYGTAVPDWVVEVVSPNDTADEVEAKTGAWLKAGVKMVWVVYPSTRRVLVHTAPDEITVFLEDDTLDGGDVLPGFQSPVKSFFEFE
jgi:Uma2 family endonuclease